MVLSPNVSFSPLNLLHIMIQSPHTNTHIYICKQFFVEQIKKLISTRQLRYVKIPPALTNSTTKEIMSKMMNELVQYSMSLANDSYQTSLCLQFTPQEIATACVYLACQFAGVEPVATTTTTGVADFKTTLGDPDLDTLFSICIQILDLISDKKASDMENVKKIRKALELMKSRDGQSLTKQQQQQQQPVSHPHKGPTDTSQPPKSKKFAMEQGSMTPPSQWTPPPPSTMNDDDTKSNKRPRVG
jgi:hypothetical protein